MAKVISKKERQAAYQKVFCQQGFNIGKASGLPRPENSGVNYNKRDSQKVK